MDVKKNFKLAAKELFGEDDKSKEIKEFVPQFKESVETKAPVMPAPHPSSSKPESHPFAPEQNHSVIPEQKETSVFAKDISIVGQIRATGHIEMYGNLQGDLETDGNVKIYGKVNGNVTCGNVTMLAGAIQGNVSAQTNVQMDASSVIVGDVSAKNLTLGGKIKGNLKLSESVVFQKSALLVGDVESVRFSVEEGAELNGNISMPNRDHDNAFSEKL